VVFKADSADPNWDIKRGADVLNVQWLERVDADAHPLKFGPGAVQTKSHCLQCCPRRSLNLRERQQTGDI
jgi:hypothetical protein